MHSGNVEKTCEGRSTLRADYPTVLSVCLPKQLGIIEPSKNQMGP